MNDPIKTIKSWADLFSDTRVIVGTVFLVVGAIFWIFGVFYNFTGDVEANQEDITNLKEGQAKQLGVNDQILKQLNEIKVEQATIGANVSGLQTLNNQNQDLIEQVIHILTGK